MTSTKTIQEQLDHALLEIEKLNLKVSAYEKKLNNGIELVNEPVSNGLFRIDQINVNWLRQKALDKIFGPGFGSLTRGLAPRVTNEMIKPIALELAAEIEEDAPRRHAAGADPEYVDFAIDAVVELFKDK